MNTPRMLDFPVGVAWALAWLTLALVAAMVLGLVLLRWWRWRREPQLVAFEARWQPLLLACIAGEKRRVKPTMNNGPLGCSA